MTTPAAGTAAPAPAAAPPAAGGAAAEGDKNTAAPVVGADGKPVVPAAKPETPAERVTPKEVLEFRENQRRIGELQRKVEAESASLKDLRELKARLDGVGDDHLARAQVLGVDLEQVVKQYAERGPIDPELIKQRQEMAALRKQQEESEKQRTAEREHGQRLMMNNLIASKQGEIKALLETAGEKFELTRVWSTPADVWRVADNAVRSGAPAPTSPAQWHALFEKAAELIEKTHEDRLSSSTSLKKVEALLAKARAAAAAAKDPKDVKPAPAAGGEDKPKPSKKLSRKEEEAILLREIEKAAAKT